MLIGIDEVGLGAWAGPLVVCAFAAPDESWRIPHLNDSKKVSRKRREELSEILAASFQGRYAFTYVTAAEIDKVGMGRALPMAMDAVLWQLVDQVGLPDRVIIDGMAKGRGISGAEYYPRADGTYPCVMAASILAKVSRDRHVAGYDETHPGYGFSQHVGYGTKEHQVALMKLGPCAVHRRSVRPIRELLTWKHPAVAKEASDDQTSAR